MVGSAGVGSSYNSPACRHPQAGKVSEDILKAQSEVASDVFQHRSSGSYCANGVPDVGPQVSFIVFAFPHACVTERLAGVAAGDDIHGFDLRPIHLCDVAQVGHAWVVGFHDLAGRRLNFGVPSQVAAYGQIQAAVAAKQAANSHANASLNCLRCSAASGSSPYTCAHR